MSTLYWELGRRRPTEIGWATYMNSILQNDAYHALIMQSVTLTEDTFAKGLQFKKYFLLTENSYCLLAKIELINNSDQDISNSGDSFLMTIESTVDLGDEGRVAWCDNGTVTISESR